MNIDLPAGKYVVAVSGGVDSVVLLHLLAQKQRLEARDWRLENPSNLQPPTSNLRLTVAHFDHGIRPDSAEDRKLVQKLAKKYGLPFVYHTGKLGPNASEAAARKARYAFLHEVRRASGADAIITAHHQDDMLETAILNLLRGTGRRGLSSLKSTDILQRPLLHATKTQIRHYATEHKLAWREDSTNADERYLRNYIRRRILPRFDAPSRQQLLDIVERAAHLNAHIERELLEYFQLQPSPRTLNRLVFVQLPHAVAREVLAGWLRKYTAGTFNKASLERLVVAAKTGKAGSRADIDAGHWLHVSREYLALQARKR